jgi:hypothetical protein
MMRTLIASSQPVVNGSALSSILHQGVAQLDTITFATNSKLLSKGSLPESTFSVAFSFTEESGAHDAQLLTELYSSLVPSGTLTIVEKGHEVLVHLCASSIESKSIIPGFITGFRGAMPGIAKALLVPVIKLNCGSRVCQINVAGHCCLGEEAGVGRLCRLQESNIFQRRCHGTQPPF